MRKPSSIGDEWNRHNMDAFARLFAEGADFVGPAGARWIGRAAIKEVHRASNATVLKNSGLPMTDTLVRSLKPDLAVSRS